MKNALRLSLALLTGVSFITSSCEKQAANSGAAAPSAQTTQSAQGTGQEITWEEAKAWTATYQATFPTRVKSSYYAASVYKKLLSQPNVTGIRIYNATNSTGDCLVLVGATESSDFTEAPYEVYDKGQRCPDMCVTSDLNHGSSSSGGSASTSTGEQITFDQAKAWTAAYQIAHPNGLKSSYYTTSVFEALLTQPTATGIRVYNAKQGDVTSFVLVGATPSMDLTGTQNKVFGLATACSGTCAYVSPFLN